MLTVENDWVQYEATTPVRRVAVRGGANCAVRIPTVRERPVPVLRSAQAARSLPASRAAAARLLPAASVRTDRALRLTRRGRLVLVVLPALLAASVATIAAGAAGADGVHMSTGSAAVAGR